ncbi:MAG: NYN domain-containing protein [Sciscionella sp.]
MENNFFFVDGSALLSDVKRLRNEDSTFANRRLCLTTFARIMAMEPWFASFHQNIFRRFTYYFVEGDDRLDKDLIVPDTSKPGVIEDLRIERCGKAIKEFRAAQDWLKEHNAPQHVADCLYRAEKAVDTQICADALQLAAVGKLERLFLYTNDYDFVPLCRALRHLGLNINLFRLKAFSVNKELASEADALHEFPADSLQRCFLPKVPSDASATELTPEFRIPT